MRAELHQALLCLLAGAVSCGALARLGLPPSTFETSCSVYKAKGDLLQNPLNPAQDIGRIQRPDAALLVGEVGRPAHLPRDCF